MPPMRISPDELARRFADADRRVVLLRRATLERRLSAATS